MTPEIKSGSKIGLIIGGVVVGLAVVGLVVWAIWRNPVTPTTEDTTTDVVTEETTTTATVTEETTTPVVDPTAGWKTYTNDTYGYSFRYPAEWRVGERESTTAPGSFDYVGTYQVRTVGFTDQLLQEGGSSIVQTPYASFSTGVYVISGGSSINAEMSLRDKALFFSEGSSQPCQNNISNAIVAGRSAERCDYRDSSYGGLNTESALAFVEIAADRVLAIDMTNNGELTNDQKQTYRDVLELILDSVQIL